MTFNVFTAVFAALFFLHHGFELVLDVLQYRHLLKRKDRVPKHLEGKVDLDTIRKAVAYNKDKLRFGMVTSLLDIGVLLSMLLFGFAYIDALVARLDQGSLLSGLLFFAVFGAVSMLLALPVDLYFTFVIEERHGFNRQRFGGFFADKAKAMLVSIVMGAALISLVLTLMNDGGQYWWLIAFVGVALFQLLAAWLYPIVIMPLFNKFTDVPEELAADVARLAKRVGFPLGRVYTMDGSKRSKHSNAFIVGLKGARKIVLYDTLVEEIDRPKLLAVLAHELGHFKLKHLTKRLIFVVVGLFLMFFALSVLKDLEGLYTGLGFQRITAHAALVVFSLLVSEVLAPFGWLMRSRSRRDEKAADRFAVEATGNVEDLAEALIALNKQNLASPGSHSLYRHYHNSHPALKERLRAIRALTP
jgi:STE24 endopeptidase